MILTQGFEAHNFLDHLWSLIQHTVRQLDQLDKKNFDKSGV